MKIQPESIILARESRGLTQKALANATNVEQGTISKIEKGILEVNQNLLERICQTLNYPPDFFKERFIRIKGHYRKKISIPVIQFKSIEAIMTIVEKHFTILHDAVELPTVSLPSWDIEEDGDAELAAIYTREFWRMPKGRVENLTNLLENKGFVIIEIDLGDLDGLSTFSESNHPIIFLNAKRTSDRLRFTLAHELGHFILHWGKKINELRDIEREANDFASEFLIPSRDILPFLDRLNLSILSNLKSYWKVSMKAIVKKAHKLKKINEDQYYYLNKSLNASGYAKGEPEIFPKEKPTLLSEIFDYYLSELDYTKEDLAQLLKISLSELNYLYFNQNGRFLRIIKNEGLSSTYCSVVNN